MTRVDLDDGGFLDVPMTAGEILFADYCDWRARDVERLRQGAEIDFADYYAAVVDAVLEIMAPGQYAGEDDATYKARVQEVTAKVQALGFGSALEIERGVLTFGEDLTLLRLYGHLLAVINTEQAPTLPFNHPDENGEMTEWDLCAEIDDYLLGGGKFSTGETITVVELSRDFRKVRDEVEAGNADYLALANVDFELNLRTFAVLVRKKGEMLPMNTLDRQKLIDKRIRTFSNLSMDIVNGINFFLRATLVALILGGTNRARHRTNFFGKAGIWSSSPERKQRTTRAGEKKQKKRVSS